MAAGGASVAQAQRLLPRLRPATSGRSFSMPAADPNMEGFLGRTIIDRLLQRKPLQPAELRAAPSTICVTGARSELAL